MQLQQIAGALLLCAVFASCHSKTTPGHNENFDLITEKVYLVRENKPATQSPEVDSALAKQANFIAYLEKNGFKKHVITKDSVLFHRENGEEVSMSLTPPADIWEMETIIAFDPAKNPFFVNLHKDSTQLVHYVQGK